MHEEWAGILYSLDFYYDTDADSNLIVENNFVLVFFFTQPHLSRYIAIIKYIERELYCT